MLALVSGVAPPASAAPAADAVCKPVDCDDQDGDFHDPTGEFGIVERRPDGVHVRGAARDIDGGPVTVDISIDGTKVGSLVANQPGDVFAGVVTPRNGTRVCAIARNVGPGLNGDLGCEFLTISVDPYGAFDELVHANGLVTLRGWTIDPDSVAPTDVHVYVDNVWTGVPVRAGGARPDIGQSNPPYGPDHGFAVTLPENPNDGTHTVCVYGMNTGPGIGTTNTQLGCKTYTVRHLPFGGYDELTRTGSTLTVRGWAADPDQKTTPVLVDVSVDNAVVRTVTANGARPDIGASMPDYGPAHGFAVDVAAAMTAGNHTVCVSARNLSLGALGSVSLGCKAYSVRSPVAQPVVAYEAMSKQVELDWADDSAAQRFRVERLEGGSWRLLTDNAGRSAWTDASLTPDTEYCYRVTAVNDRPSEATGSVCARTLKLPLPAVTDVRITAATDTSITLHWRDNALEETGQVVAWKVAGADGGTAKRVELPASAGTGEMTYTVTGLTPNTEYEVGTLPAAPGFEPSTYAIVRGWTSGPPVVMSFTATPNRVEACVPADVTLRWQVKGAARVVVNRGNTELANRPHSGQAAFEDSVAAGRTDGNVTYTITVVGVDGRTTTSSTSVQRTTSLPLFKRIEFTNTGYHTLEAGYYNLNGDRIELIDSISPGGTIGVDPGHCQVRRLQIVDPATGRIAFEIGDRGLILGHDQGEYLQYSAG